MASTDRNSKRTSPSARRISLLSSISWEKATGSLKCIPIPESAIFDNDGGQLGKGQPSLQWVPAGSVTTQTVHRRDLYRRGLTDGDEALSTPNDTPWSEGHVTRGSRISQKVRVDARKVAPHDLILSYRDRRLSRFRDASGRLPSILRWIVNWPWCRYECILE